jgi:hypothetical protein
MRVRYSFSSRRTRRTKKIKKQKEKFPNILKKIIENSDIILEVLDARFIYETRNLEIEKSIKKQGKEIIYVINKIDLVKKINKEELKKLEPYTLVSYKLRKGGRELRNKIKLESKKIKKHKILVGVIGYPNTGKSSLINLLIGKNKAKTGAEAGFTKGVQKLKLTQNILLLDSPGVIPVEEYSNINKDAIVRHAKLSARTYSKVKDPELVISNLIKEHRGMLEKYYKINAKGDSEILIEELGKRKNFLKKGGEVNFDKTSRFILREWQEGKIIA